MAEQPTSTEYHQGRAVRDWVGTVLTPVYKEARQLTVIRF